MHQIQKAINSQRNERAKGKEKKKTTLFFFSPFLLSLNIFGEKQLIQTENTTIFISESFIFYEITSSSQSTSPLMTQSSGHRNI